MILLVAVAFVHVPVLGGIIFTLCEQHAIGDGDIACRYSLYSLRCCAIPTYPGNTFDSVCVAPTCVCIILSLSPPLSQDLLSLISNSVFFYHQMTFIVSCDVVSWQYQFGSAQTCTIAVQEENNSLLTTTLPCSICYLQPIPGRLLPSMRQYNGLLMVVPLLHTPSSHFICFCNFICHALVVVDEQCGDAGTQ